MNESASILSHISNSGIVHLPGRRFPGIAIQGDTLSALYDSTLYLLTQFREQNAEEEYYEVLPIAEQLHAHLLHYEKTLKEHGFDLPYSKPITERPVPGDFDEQ